MPVQLKIRNKDRLFQNLKNTVPELDTNLRKALAKSGDEWETKAKLLAPRDSGALARSIGWTFGTVPATAKLVKTVAKGPNSSPSISLYAGDKVAYYAAFVEFGTAAGSKGSRTETTYYKIPEYKGRGRRHTGRRIGRKVKRNHPGTVAQPYFFPAYRILRTRIKGRLSRAVSGTIKKAGF